MQKANSIKLHGLSVDQLIAVRAAADNLIRERLQTEKRDLQAKLASIVKYEEGYIKEARKTAATKKPQKSAKHASKVAPKYRDPHSGQTWAGRGLQPRWLREALAAGKSSDEFLIGAGAS